MLRGNTVQSLQSHDSELRLYKMLVSTEFPSNVQRPVWKGQKFQFKEHIVNKCLSKRLKGSCLYELIIIRRFVDLSSTDNILSKKFDSQILNKLNDPNEKDSIFVLCNCLADIPNQLQWYIAEILQKIWPGKEDKVLEFLLKDQLFVAIYTLSFQFPLFSPEWKQRISKGLAALVDAINGAATGNEKIRTLKLLESTRETCMQIVKLMNNSVKKLNVISGLFFLLQACYFKFL